MNARTSLALALLLSSALPACDDNDTQKNPDFEASGGSSSASGGKASAGDSGTPGSGGAGGATASGGAGGTAAGGTPATGGVPAGSGGSDESGGATGTGGTEEPPYDCVLHPTTHLEIINACTNAIRVEKAPNLPPPS
jgi:hypothetical protein